MPHPPDRRRFVASALSAGIAAAALPGCAQSASHSTGNAVASATPRTIVLLPPGWCGGWIYRKTADWLSARGHKVYTPTLTGLGERAHLLRPDTNLDTHIADVLALIRFEGLSNVTLVSHSFSGPVAVGVADKLPAAISAAIFVNAYLPDSGQAITDIFTERGRNAVLARQRKGELGDPTPPAAFFMVEQKDWAWLDALHTPQPINVQTQKLVHGGGIYKVPKKTYVLGARFARGRDYETLYYARFKTDPAWRTVELDSGHLPMVEMPERLGQVIEEGSA